MQNIDLSKMTPIEHNREPFKIKEVSKLDNQTDVELALLSMQEDHWRMAQLKKRGHSMQDIARHFKYKYTINEISCILINILKINNFLSVNNTELLKRQMLDELEDLEKIAWNNAYINESEQTQLDNKDIKTILAIKQSRMKILGVEAPTEVKMDITHKTEMASEQLKLTYESYMRSKGKVIDVTPVSEDK